MSHKLIIVKKKSWPIYIGNFLMIISFLALSYIYFPLLSLYLFPPTLAKELPTQGTFITIPKINAQASIILDVDPMNEVEYRKSLESGVAHAKGTSLPGQSGKIFLFAHSSDNPLNITRINTIFLKLDELKIGDEILLQKDGQKFKYLVSDKKVVWPSEIKYLQPDSTPQLILQTCTPIGTSLKRLLIFAKPS